MDSVKEAIIMLENIGYTVLDEDDTTRIDEALTSIYYARQAIQETIER